jgi:predicted nuclease of predicted toxin-antitoxin system
LKLLADEGVDRQIVARLRADGPEVLYVAEMEPGIADEDVLTRARLEGRLLITPDKDFGELVFRQGLAANGVLLLRLSGLAVETKCDRVSRSLAMHADEMQGAFTVLSQIALRIRRLQ